MEHKDYTPGELGILLKNIADDVKDIKDKDLPRIEKHVVATNGRVKSLELWRMFLIGAWAVVTIVTPIAWFFMAQSFESFKSNIDQRIGDAIQRNNDKYFEQ